MSFFSFNKAPTISDDNIIQEWSQLVLGMGNKGEEFLKKVAQSIQNLNMPNTTLARKEATLGNSNNRYEFVSVKHEKYPDYEVWIGAIERMGQLNLIDPKAARGTPASAYFDNSFVADLKQSGFFDALWK